MEEINVRFKELRKACKKSQTEFGDVLGISSSGVANIETGQRNVNAKHLIMLSRWEEYHVNIDWLRTGEGEMFLETETDALEKIKKEYNLNDRQFRFVSSFLRLPENERDVIMKWLESVFADQKSTENSENFPSDRDQLEQYIAEQEKEYGNQLRMQFDSRGKSEASSEAKEA